MLCVSTVLLCKGSIACKGNGITLGLTDSVANYGLITTNGAGNQDDNNTGVYGTAVGSAGSGSNIYNFKSVGVTTDSSKSGIITESHSHTLTTLQCGTWVIKYA